MKLCLLNASQGSFVAELILSMVEGLLKMIYLRRLF